MEQTDKKSNSGFAKQELGSSGSSTPFKSPSATSSRPPLAPASFSATQEDQSRVPKVGSSPFSSSQHLGFGTQSTNQRASTPNQQPGSVSFSPSTQAGTPTTFTQTTTSPPSWASPLAGKTPREVLTAFYQQRNPSKLGEVDKLLAKYRGNVSCVILEFSRFYCRC